MLHSRNGSLCLLVLLLLTSLTSAVCQSQPAESSEGSARPPKKLRRTLRTQHTKAGVASRAGLESDEQVEGRTATAPLAAAQTEDQLQDESQLQTISQVVTANDAPASVSHSIKHPPDQPAHSKSNTSRLRIPKILHQLYFVSDKNKDYETGSIVDKQFPKKWQASCKAAFPDWEYRSAFCVQQILLRC